MRVGGLDHRLRSWLAYYKIRPTRRSQNLTQFGWTHNASTLVELVLIKLVEVVVGDQLVGIHQVYHGSTVT